MMKSGISRRSSKTVVHKRCAVKIQAGSLLLTLRKRRNMVVIGDLLRYTPAKNYHYRASFDKVIAKPTWCGFLTRIVHWITTACISHQQKDTQTLYTITSHHYFTHWYLLHNSTWRTSDNANNTAKNKLPARRAQALRITMTEHWVLDYNSCWLEYSTGRISSYLLSTL